MINLMIDVECMQAPWAKVHNPNTNLQLPAYRLYLNEELMSERTWHWQEDDIIKEELWVNILPNQIHNFKIEPILGDPKQAEFKIANLIGRNCPLFIHQKNQTQMLFEIN